MTPQLQLPGQAHAAEGAIDHSAMYLMHFAFRRDLGHLVGAVSCTPPEDTATWRALLEYWDLFADLLHHHHTAEDEVYWPALAAAVHTNGTPQDHAVLAAMQDEHASIEPALRRCRLGFEAMLADPTPSSLTVLRDALLEARRVVDEHLSHEESETLPLVSRVMSASAYAAVEKRIGRSYPMRSVPTMVPWVFHGLPPQAQGHVLALAGTPHRILLRLTRGRFERRHHAAFTHLPAR